MLHSIQAENFGGKFKMSCLSECKRIITVIGLLFFHIQLTGRNFVAEIHQPTDMVENLFLSAVFLFVE
jgi:hypothetical protein